MDSEAVAVFAALAGFGFVRFSFFIRGIGWRQSSRVFDDGEATAGRDEALVAGECEAGCGLAAGGSFAGEGSVLKAGGL